MCGLRLSFCHFIAFGGDGGNTQRQCNLPRLVFKTQKEKLTTGDFVKLVEQDMSNLNVTYKDVTKKTKSDLKQEIEKVQCRYVLRN